MRRERDTYKSGGTVRGIAFILSAPSGAGKTTIAHDVVRGMRAIRISISHTTRPPRGREKNGRDYHFVTPEDFFRMEREGCFLETAYVHDNYYGTHTDEVAPYLTAGTDVILDIDVQGAAIIRNKIDTIGIFILPPGMDELMRRLKQRDTEGQQIISKRIQNARREVRDASSYDYLVINDDLGRAVGEVISIITAERMRMTRRRPIVDKFLRENG